MQWQDCRGGRSVEKENKRWELKEHDISPWKRRKGRDCHRLTPRTFRRRMEQLVKALNMLESIVERAKRTYYGVSGTTGLPGGRFP
jgi:hypothetical protein